MHARAEWFGALVALKRPALTFSVNRELAKLLRIDGGERWRGEDPGRLSAPLEMQLELSRRCSVGCGTCFTSSTPRGAVMPLEEAKNRVDALARAGVFHLAIGGGEPTDVPHLFDVAAHARARGLTVAVTTAGVGLTEALARRLARAFDQINVSVELDAARLLRRHTRRVGVNFVVTRTSFDALGDVAARAKSLRVNQLQLLRFKPVGRSADEPITREQARAFWPRVQRLALRHRLRIRLDCSFAPLVFAHSPPLALARFFGITGCKGGDLFGAITADGRTQPCGFTALDVGAFAANAPEPCRSCEYLSLCNGGCRAASGGAFTPDPLCPRVANYNTIAAPR